MAKAEILLVEDEKIVALDISGYFGKFRICIFNIPI
jgi:hypothetical protein